MYFVNKGTNIHLYFIVFIYVHTLIIFIYYYYLKTLLNNIEYKKSFFSLKYIYY